MMLFQRIWLKLLRIWWQFIVPIRLRAIGVTLGESVVFYGMPIVSMVKGSRISICDGVVLCSDSRFTALGVNHPVVLRTLRTGAQIVLGENTGISGGGICAAVSVILGKDCLIGANVTIADTDFHAIKSKNRRSNNNDCDIKTSKIDIGNNVFIGTGSLVLKGVTIGENSVVGAHSVIRGNIPSDVVWLGVHANHSASVNIKNI